MSDTSSQNKMAEKLQGSVKWFSNKKGYGFVTPNEGSSVTEDVFVHQSSIFCEGYRTLDEGWEVEFEIGHDDDGKIKAVSVTAPGGGPCFGPRRSRSARSSTRKEGAEPGTGSTGGTGRRGSGPKKPRDPFWHEGLSEDVRVSLESKDIRSSTGTLDISVGDARVKLGTNGYASMAHASGRLAEGSFACDVEGNATFTWQYCIEYDTDSGEWITNSDYDMCPPSFSLVAGNIEAVGQDENAETLWGPLPDPKDALEENGFLMRHVVLVPRMRKN